MIKADDQPCRLLAEIGDMGDRTGGILDQRQEITIGFGAGDDDASRLLRQEGSEFAGLAVGMMERTGILHAEFGGAQAILDADHQAGKAVLVQSGRDDADDAVMEAGERPGGKIGDVAHLVYRAQDGLTQILRDDFRIAKRARNRDGADPHLLRHIAQLHMRAAPGFPPPLHCCPHPPLYVARETLALESRSLLFEEEII